MDLIGNKLYEIRKSKSLTQEELAELSKINLRTIQRIENNENEPRGKTLKLICEALEIKSSDLIKKEQLTSSSKIGLIFFSGFFLIILNLGLMLVLGFMTLESNANINSRIGAFLISFFIPFFIVYCTQKMTGIERLLKFGFGYLSYIIIIFIGQGIGSGLQNGLTINFIIPCIIISIGVLYYGKLLLRFKN
jgi:transcriptional regulator with XRE-family HTH domain